jgi:hypothetical protein
MIAFAIGSVMAKTLMEYATVALLGLLTGCAFVGIDIAAQAALVNPFETKSAWLAVPLAAPFGILVAMLIRRKMSETGGRHDIWMFAMVIAATVVALVLAAGSADFLLSDDNTPDQVVYSMSGVVAGFVGAAFMAIIIWNLLKGRNIRFAGWPMVIAGTVVGALWSEGAFEIRPPLAASWLLFALWQACVAMAVWFGLQKAAWNSICS